MKVKKPLNVKIEEDNLAILDEIASRLGMSRAALVRILVLQQIDAYKKSGDPLLFLNRKEH